MKKIILSVFVVGALLTSCGDSAVEASDAENVELVQGEETMEYSTVKEGSLLKWSATHFGGVGERYGVINVSSSSVLVNNGQLSNLDAVIDMKSFTVDNFSEEEAEDAGKLAGHLQSPDFFDVENNPTSKFELTKIESAEGDYNSTLTGNLTIMAETKSITFKANVSVSDTEVSIHSEDFIIDRTDWNLSYHIEGSEGVPIDYIIANELGFTINMTVSK